MASILNSVAPITFTASKSSVVVTFQGVEYILTPDRPTVTIGMDYDAPVVLHDRALWSLLTNKYVRGIFNAGKTDMAAKYQEDCRDFSRENVAALRDLAKALHKLGGTPSVQNGRLSAIAQLGAAAKLRTGWPVRDAADVVADFEAAA